MNNEKYLDISWLSILKIFTAGFCFYGLYLISNFLVWLAFAFVISVLFEPIIESLEKIKIPRGLSTAFIYISMFSILSVAIYLTIPYIISEIQYFSKYFPQYFIEYFSKISPFFQKMGFETFQNLETFLIKSQEVLANTTGNIFNILFSLFGGVTNALFIISIAIFISLEKKQIDKNLTLIFPKKYENHFLLAWKKSQKKISAWFLIRIIGCVFVAISSYMAFMFLDAEYPVSLAIMTGIFDFIPIIGPFIATIIIFGIISMDSFLKALFVITAFALIQVIENTIFLPILSKKIIQVSPIAIIFALFVGAKFWGILGAILAVPLIIILLDFLKDFLTEIKHREQETPEIE